MKKFLLILLFLAGYYGFSQEKNLNNNSKCKIRSKTLKPFNLIRRFMRQCAGRSLANHIQDRRPSLGLSNALKKTLWQFNINSSFA